MRSAGAGYRRDSRSRTPWKSPLAGANTAQALRIALAQHPALRRLDAVIKQKELLIQRELKAWYPDLKPGFNLGQGIDARTLGAGLGLELPFWNRNKAGIRGGAGRASSSPGRARAGAPGNPAGHRDRRAGLRKRAGSNSRPFRPACAPPRPSRWVSKPSCIRKARPTSCACSTPAAPPRQTEAEYLQALVDANIARAELERAIGIGGNQE